MPTNSDDPTLNGASRLDAALEAAFGPETIADDDLVSAGPATVTARLGLHGPRLLRDEPDEEPSRVLAAVGQRRASGEGTARYQVLGEIARGGVGVVMKSRDMDLGRDVAMKVLKPEHAQSQAMIERFVEEAQIAGQLQHPGILPVYELGLERERTPYFTMKLVKGRTLAALLKETTPGVETWSRHLRTFESICQTVAYAHARGVIHRDLKPANVMVGAFGEVQVVDWGLAKVLGTGDDAATRAAAHETVVATERSESGDRGSIVGSVMGTPAYMAPEQARGDVARLDERADVFALGAILCEILTGAAPFADTPDPLAAASAGRLDDAFARLDASGADAALVALTRACLDPDPGRRPVDAKAVADRVTAYLTSTAERARALEVKAAEARAKAVEERRARRLTVVLASVILLVFVGAVAIWLRAETQRRDRIDVATNRVESQLNDASRRLGEAQVAPLGSTDAWIAARAAGANLRSLTQTDDVTSATRARAEAFLTTLDVADRDRQLIETIEDVVIRGATHSDIASWVWMEEQLRASFLEYGIDLLAMDKQEVAARIRESTLTRQLADGLELWLATCFTLANAGAAEQDAAALFAWVPVLFEADPDPVRRDIREILYSEAPTREQLDALVARIDVDALHPRTASWLAATYFRTGDLEPVVALYERALTRHPDDLMLNFDYAFNLEHMGEYRTAVRYYDRCVGMRPGSAGVWRSLGNALRETGDLAGSRTALARALELMPDHVPIVVDLAYTRALMGETDDAIAVYRAALVEDPDLAPAHCYLGRALQERGDLEEALASLERCHELGGRNPLWREPSAEWLEACRAELEALGRGRGEDSRQ